jgi:hypothetical protein
VLTPGEGAVEQTALSADRKTSVLHDERRRHRAPPHLESAHRGGTAEQVTRGETIETYPAVLSSGKQVAVLGGDAKRPFGVGIVPCKAAPRSTSTRR